MIAPQNIKISDEESCKKEIQEIYETLSSPWRSDENYKSYSVSCNKASSIADYYSRLGWYVICGDSRCGVFQSLYFCRTKPKLKKWYNRLISYSSIDSYEF
jgi:hypothetical protein